MRGRQAEAARNDQQLLDAARDVFATHGFDAPVSAVAAAAGIGMGSLYRRYATKDELLADLCLRSMRAMSDAATSTPTDLPPMARLSAFIHACTAAKCGAFAPIAGRIPVSDEMISEARRSQRAAEELLVAAQSDGSVRADVTVVDVLRLIELFSRARSGPSDVGFAPAQARLLALAIAGLSSDRTEPLPGDAATLAAYRDRWSTES